MVTAEFQQFTKLSGIVSQTVVVSGGLVSGGGISTRIPQAAIVWGNTCATNIWHNDCNMILGFSDGTNDASIAIMSDDAESSAWTASAHHNDKVYISYNEQMRAIGAPALLADASVSSFSSGKVNLTWHNNNTPIVAEKINMMTLYGVSGVEVGTREVGTASVGIQTYNLSNTTLNPDVILLTSTNIKSPDLPVGSTMGVTPGTFSVGAAMSGKQWSIAMNTQNGVSPSIADRYLSVSHCLSLYSHTGTSTGEANLNGFVSGAFKLNWTTAPDNATRNFSYIAIAGKSFDLGFYRDPTDPARSGSSFFGPVAKIVPVSAEINRIRGLMLFSQNHDTLGQINNSEMTIGGASAGHPSIGGPPRQGYSATGENEGNVSTITARIQDTDYIMISFLVFDAPSSSTVTTLSKITSLSTTDTGMGNETFELEYPINNVASGNYICYLAIGDGPEPASAQAAPLPTPVFVQAPGQSANILPI